MSETCQDMVGSSKMTPSGLQLRTKQFALRVIAMTNAVPNTAAGRAIASQLVRACTSVGANYRACCRARSLAEFISKMGIGEEEADESAFWMELLIDSGMLKAQVVQPFAVEATQLARIMAASRISAAKHRVTSSNRQSAIDNRQSPQAPT